MSASFARAVLLSRNRVKINGVRRCDKKGIPDCVKQVELKNEKLVLQTRNTVKVAVLEGDDVIEDLVAISYFGVITKLCEPQICTFRIFSQN